MGRPSKELQNFNGMMDTLLKADHNKVRAELEAEKVEKAEKKRKSKLPLTGENTAPKNRKKRSVQ